ncbi:Ribonuclease H-like superfamily [Arabidopsis suecica]|uniref:Ribonuclease H-like superfamily n=1 Tax=Arabidopsis suecica TaxID=45249 RepID=A0A8T2CRU3_ARASU|nr:Ribonuclease H-like superfamily [Arabidopsis suecica]
MSRILHLYNTKDIQEHDRLLPIWITWRIWKSRCDYIFRKINRSPTSEARKGSQDVYEWLEATTTNSTDTNIDHNGPIRCPRRDNNTQWNPPPEGWVKCNFDSGYVKDRGFTSTGWIVRDHNGQVIHAGCAKIPKSHSPLEAEALGFLNALQVSWIHGLRKVWFETDNLELNDLINNGGDNINIGTILYDLRHWMMKLPMSSLGHVNRERNIAADLLCRKASSMNCLYQIFLTPPHWLVNSLYYPYTV